MAFLFVFFRDQISFQQEKNSIRYLDLPLSYLYLELFSKKKKWKTKKKPTEFWKQVFPKNMKISENKKWESWQVRNLIF